MILRLSHNQCDGPEEYSSGHFVWGSLCFRMVLTGLYIKNLLWVKKWTMRIFFFILLSIFTIKQKFWPEMWLIYLSANLFKASHWKKRWGNRLSVQPVAFLPTLSCLRSDSVPQFKWLLTYYVEIMTGNFSVQKFSSIIFHAVQSWAQVKEIIKQHISGTHVKKKNSVFTHHFRVYMMYPCRSCDSHPLIQHKPKDLPSHLREQAIFLLSPGLHTPRYWAPCSFLQSLLKEQTENPFGCVELLCALHSTRSPGPGAVFLPFSLFQGRSQRGT